MNFSNRARLASIISKLLLKWLMILDLKNKKSIILLTFKKTSDNLNFPLNDIFKNLTRSAKYDEILILK